jgi:hypothetical protein
MGLKISLIARRSIFVFIAYILFCQRKAKAIFSYGKKNFVIFYLSILAFLAL